MGENRGRVPVKTHFSGASPLIESPYEVESAYEGRCWFSSGFLGSRPSHAPARPHARTHACTRVCACTHVYARVRTRMRPPARPRMRVCTPARVCAYARPHAYARMHARIRKRILIHNRNHRLRAPGGRFLTFSSPGKVMTAGGVSNGF